MKKYLILLLTVCLLLAGCSENVTDLKPEDRPPDSEPTAAYDWMAGESPVPEKRMGIIRYGVNTCSHAISPQGTYFVHKSMLLYADHGSDTLVKLCGRVDCTHDDEDCNAYVFSCSSVAYEQGYVYASNYFNGDEKCQLIRMEPDGSNHVVVLDMLAFAQEHDGEYAICETLDRGYCIFRIGHWVTTYEDAFSSQRTQETLGTYMYKLDGSMAEPVPLAPTGGLYHCGDTLLCIDEDNNLYSGDMEAGTKTFLTEHPGYTGYYDENNGYYFKDGSVIRYDYATKAETVLFETGLEGKYLLFMFPDCMVLASRARENPDPNLYFYNWNYELVDTVRIPYKFEGPTDIVLMAETAERFILTDDVGPTALPLYFINKSELGTGKVELHAFNQN